MIKPTGKKLQENKHIGSSFDDFLREQGVFNQVNDEARMRVALFNALKLAEYAGRTPSEIADELRVSRPTVIRWLRGKNYPQILIAQKLIEYLVNKYGPAS